jgi:hypothetical protein
LQTPLKIIMKYKVIKEFYHLGTRKIGKIIELDEDYAKALGSKFIEKIKEEKENIEVQENTKPKKSKSKKNK